MNVEEHVRNLTNTPEEKIRVEEELILYRKYNVLNVLKFLVYLIDIMRSNNIVWGVGRGSSASLCFIFAWSTQGRSHQIWVRYY